MRLSRLVRVKRKLVGTTSQCILQRIIQVMNKNQHVRVLPNDMPLNIKNYWLKVSNIQNRRRRWLLSYQRDRNFDIQKEAADICFIYIYQLKVLWWKTHICGTRASFPLTCSDKFLCWFFFFFWSGRFPKKTSGLNFPDL